MKKCIFLFLFPLSLFGQNYPIRGNIVPVLGYPDSIGTPALHWKTIWVDNYFGLGTESRADSTYRLSKLFKYTDTTAFRAQFLKNADSALFAYKAITLSAGTAMSSTGLGDLSANRTINADTTFWADADNSGFLKYTSYNIFNAKQSAITNLADTSLYKKKTDSTDAISGYTSLYQNSLKSTIAQGLQWDGGSTNLVAATGRTSLGLGNMALVADSNRAAWTDKANAFTGYPQIMRSLQVDTIRTYLNKDLYFPTTGGYSLRLQANGSRMWLNDSTANPGNAGFYFSKDWSTRSIFAMGLDTAPNDSIPYFYIYQNRGASPGTTGDILAITPRRFDGTNSWEFGSGAQGDTTSLWKYHFYSDRDYAMLIEPSASPPTTPKGIYLKISKVGDSTAYGYRIKDNGDNGVTANRYFVPLMIEDSVGTTWGLVHDIQKNYARTLSVYSFATGQEFMRFGTTNMRFFRDALFDANIIGSGNALFSNASIVGLNTSDASDNGYLGISGGGGGGDTRGAGFYLSGNERTTYGGQLAIFAGDAGATGFINFNTASTERMRIANDGTITMGTNAISAGTAQLTTVRGSDTVKAGTQNGATYSYIIPGGALVQSSDESLKENIKPFTVNLANFSKVSPRKYNFKEKNFYETFDEKSVPDSVDVKIDSVRTKRVSNKKVKDAARSKFISDNLADSKRRNKIEYSGFLANEFNQQILGKQSKEINSADVTAVMWLKIQELEARIAVLEKK